MKNLKIVLFSVLAMGAVLTSCNKDDDGGTGGNIEGKWIFAKQGVAGAGQEILTDYEHTVGCAKDFIEISAGGVYKTVNYFGSECTEEADTGKWAKDGNTLTVTYGEGTSAEVTKGTIVSLTGSELKLKTTYTEGGNSVSEILLFTRAK